MRNAAERKDIRQAEKYAKVAERARIEFIQAAMSSKQGRAWFHNLLAECHIFADPFSGEALFEAYSKGERNVGLRIYTDIVMNCADDFVVMMKEASYQEQINANRDRSPTDEYDGSEDRDWGDQGSGFAEPDGRGTQ